LPEGKFFDLILVSTVDFGQPFLLAASSVNPSSTAARTWTSCVDSWLAANTSLTKSKEEEYWQPPEQFEETKKGDCEDYALWAWRQLLQMNYPARFVIGSAGRYGEGHAWVTFEKDGKAFLLEPLAWSAGLRLPRLSIIRYKPRFSVALDGEKVSYYEHEEKGFRGSFREIISLICEWLLFWFRFWITLPLKVARRFISRTRPPRSR
jgi:hypothetical protein